jgi:hypothetical protein
MGRIVLGMGTSHSPQLSTPSELWLNHGEGDKRNPGLLDNMGKHRSFEELLDMAPPSISQELTPEKMQGRHEANQKAIARLSQAFADASLDALIIIGDDQEEMFLNDNRPAIAVYWGDTFVNGQVKLTPEMSEARRSSAWGWREPDGERSFPVASDLGLHIIEYLQDQDFDMAQINRMPAHHSQMGHAFGFVYRRIMQDNVIPTIPIMINTYYPPNQPTLKRCYQFGREIREAVESLPSDTRVGVIASGGLSHFVIDEEIDGKVMKALREGDSDTLVSLPRERLNSGTSEIRNWIAMAGAAEGLDHQWSDYVPSYRTLAGTGCAMGFGIWA